MKLLQPLVWFFKLSLKKKVKVVTISLMVSAVLRFFGFVIDLFVGNKWCFLGIFLQWMSYSV